MPFRKGQSGNPSGRKRSNWRKHFDAAIEADTKKHKQSLFEHAIEQARTDNILLAAILRKCLPDMRSIEAKIDGEQPIRLLVAVPGQTVLPEAAPDKAGLPEAPEAAELPDGGSPALPPVIPVASETECNPASPHNASSHESED